MMMLSIKLSQTVYNALRDVFPTVTDAISSSTTAINCHLAKPQVIPAEVCRAINDRETGRVVH